MITLPAATQDLADLVQTLRVVSPVTVAKLRNELRAVRSQLSIFPFSYQHITELDYRRAFLYSCRHTVYFRVNPGMVEINAILPQQAGPALLARRNTPK